MTRLPLLTPFPPGLNCAFLRAKSLLGCSGYCHLWFQPQPRLGLLEFAFLVGFSPGAFDFWEERKTLESGFPELGY